MALAKMKGMKRERREYDYHKQEAEDRLEKICHNFGKWGTIFHTSSVGRAPLVSPFVLTYSTGSCQLVVVSIFVYSH